LIFHDAQKLRGRSAKAGTRNKNCNRAIGIYRAGAGSNPEHFAIRDDFAAHRLSKKRSPLAEHLSATLRLIWRKSPQKASVAGAWEVCEAITAVIAT
jgi:hypothetical protein